MKERIGVDLDGCLARGIDKQMFERLNQRFGMDYDMKRENIPNYNFKSLFPGATGHDLYDVLIDCDYVNLVPHQNGPDIVRKLKKRGYGIYIITKRCIDSPNMFHETLEWLDNYKIPYDLVTVSGRKGDLAEEYNLEAFIEDAPDNAIDIADRGVLTFLFDYPYNRGVEHDLIHRIEKWDEIYDFLEDRV